MRSISSIFSVSRGAVLLRPAIDLARDVVLAPAVVGKPDRGGLIGVQPRQRRVHRVEHGGALVRVGVRHVRHPDHAALDEAHHVERRAGDALVGAIDHRLGDREALLVERADHLELAVDRVRGGQQLARRLAPQHVFARRRFEHSRSGSTARRGTASRSAGPRSPSRSPRDRPPAARCRSAAAPTTSLVPV